MANDDDEPITREWVVALAGTIPNGQYCYFQLWKEANYRLYVQSDLGFVLCAFGQNLRLNNEWVRTRGQVRRLLAVFGITTAKEPKPMSAELEKWWENRRADEY